MIANFFQSLKDNRVDYLLISGQAAVLYGAAVFSEDIDLWVDPSEENLSRFVVALRQNGARYYKLTPALTAGHALDGHGFHFTLGAEDETFIDVMGKPPRTKGFAQAMAGANSLETDWGRLNVVGIPDLVELKKTQRLEDYPVISLLALRLARTAPKPISGELTAWALDHLFTIASLKEFLEQNPAAIQNVTGGSTSTLRRANEELRTGEDFSDATERALRQEIHARITALQEKDRAYWKRIIQDLKRLRTAGELLTEGALV